jgi:hypothetical protein
MIRDGRLTAEEELPAATGSLKIAAADLCWERYGEPLARVGHELIA